MSQGAINLNIENLENQSLEEFKNLRVKSNLENMQEIETILKTVNIEDINIFNMMIFLDKIKKIFLERRAYVQKRINELDYHIPQLQVNLALCSDIDKLIEEKQNIDKLVIEKKRLLLEKQLMKKLDKDNQFTYGMIGMAVQTFKNITSTLDWEEMKL